MIEPRYPDSISFLRRWAPTGLWVLVAIEPTAKRSIETATFDAATEEARAVAWLERVGATSNVYFHVNPVLERLSKKAERTDIAALAWIHVDVDPRVGEDLAAERVRILGLFNEALPRGIPPPTVVVFSGGGYQGFWRLRDPLPIGGDLERAESAKLYNLQVELAFRADACHNVDRIMRLPGTVNRPDEKKRKKGRTETLAEVVRWNDEAVYDLSTFTPAVPVQSKDTAGFAGPKPTISGNVKRLASVEDLGTTLDARVKAIIVAGNDPENPKKLGSRSDWVWYVTCELVRNKVDDNTIFSILTDPAFRISDHIRDQDDPEASALRQIARAHEHAIHPKLRELNERHAIVEDVAGRCRIISEVDDGLLKGRTRLSYQSAEDFKLRYLNQKIEYETADGKRSIRLGDWWLFHPNRRQYRTIVFAPGSEPEGSYNLWKGFAYPARPGGSCDRYLRHLRDVICSGNEVHYRYLLGWMATAVQNPSSPGHTAIVLRGTQGTGKSFAVKAFGSLFGRHFLQVSDPKHLVGSFNAHLRDCVVLFGDEAFYAGDKKHESVLKMLVTEETITIEAKGVDARAAPNYVHLLMASNEDWVVPAGFHERRFFVLDVDDKHKQDTAYFADLAAELDAGGYEALLYYLRTYDLTDYNVRKIPSTKGLQEQKVLSYTAEKDWWYGKLQVGEILPGLGWPRYVVAEELVSDYAKHVKLFNVSSRGSSIRLGLFLEKCCPKGWDIRTQLWGRHSIEVDGKKREVFRPHAYLLPELSSARTIWDAAFGGPFDWKAIRQLGREESTAPAEERQGDVPF